MPTGGVDALRIGRWLQGGRGAEGFDAAVTHDQRVVDADGVAGHGAHGGMLEGKGCGHGAGASQTEQGYYRILTLSQVMSELNGGR